MLAAPRVNDKRFDAATGERQRFSSAILPPWARKTPKITDVLLAFYDYPAEHWVHLRTTNPIESTFATVRHRTKITKGCDTEFVMHSFANLRANMLSWWYRA